MNLCNEIIDKLKNKKNVQKEELRLLLETEDSEVLEYLRQCAEQVRKEIYGNSIYIRGLIEFTNYCTNDCYYCGIRKSNQNAERYRLTKEEILDCCQNGYKLGFRTFVLQGGEDGYYTKERICDIIKNIHKKFPDCAITMSIGEKTREFYEAMYEAGADRYLLRHETANQEHYKKLHPKELSLKKRKECLYTLKEIGYQVGCGFMVGSPWQTTDTLLDDLEFIKGLKPHMVGIGPFIPHKDTPFLDKKPGSLELTLRLISIIRLMNPRVLIPATTALGTINSVGRERGILAGANVVMPNLSPIDVRKKYLLYDNKICTGDEAAECRFCMERRMQNIGYQVVVDRGDYR
ncbi:MAG: [FeFe] hydrogenase H-cluster radical SAM maturase HydE [Eubacterium sp.]